jgi:hypothetical protein
VTNYWLPFMTVWLPIILTALGVLLVITLRWFSYRERMALIAQGLAPEQGRNVEQKSKNLLAAGLIVGLVGLAITIALLTIGIGVWLLFGLLPLFVGLALVLTALVLRPEKAKEEQAAQQPPAWTQEAVGVEAEQGEKEEEPEEENEDLPF